MIPKAAQELEAVKKALLLLDATIMLNNYAEENVIFGQIAHGERAPIERYLSDLGLERAAPLLQFEQLEGRMIKHGVIDYDNSEDLYYEVYGDKVSVIFADVPVVKGYEDDDDPIFHFKNGLYEYLKELYHMFRAIMATEVQPDLFSAVPDLLDETERRTYYAAVTAFIVAIRLKKLKRGSCVHRYLKGLPFLSPLLMRLIEKKGNRLVLKTDDTDCLDYKLALLSCFRFYNENHAKLFEQKMLEWEAQGNGVISVR